MDRYRILLGSLLFLGVLLAPSRQIFSGMVFGPVQTDSKVTQDGDGYPESRFGQPPAPVETGIRPGYASRAVEAMEEEEVDPITGRKPASLVFEKKSPGPENQGPPQIKDKDKIMVNKGVQEVALIAGDLGYFPKTVFVSRDVPVRMFVTGASKNTLCIMMDSFQIRKQVRSQKIEEITFTPELPGKYRFYCPVNGMEGTLVVKELASINGD